MGATYPTARHNPPTDMATMAITPREQYPTSHDVSSPTWRPKVGSLSDVAPGKHPAVVSMVRDAAPAPARVAVPGVFLEGGGVGLRRVRDGVRQGGFREGMGGC